MASKTKSEGQWIQFLLVCLDCCEGKVNYEEVAKRTGWYKTGKFSKQALDNLKKKYPWGKELENASNGGREAGGAHKRKAEGGAATPGKRAKKVDNAKSEGNDETPKLKAEDVDDA